MPLERVGASFRDPAGFVFQRDGVLYRQVNETYRPHFEHLISSGLHAALVERDLLIPHEDLGAGPAAAPGAFTVLQPTRVPFVSYPYEWCFSQLKDAARATLEIQKIAMEHGMSLRDASAYNIQFLRSKPVMIDTLSFEVIREGEPWVAYRQFCQHFLAPLALMSYVDVRLQQLLRAHIDGLPLDLAAEILPRRSKMRPSLMLHLHAHARSQKRHAGEDVSARKSTRTFSARAFKGLVESLDGAVRGLDWEPPSTVWTEYYSEAGSYTAESTEHKRALVAKLVEEVAPSSMWDLGGNVGTFARIASEKGIDTVLFDVDPGCIETAYRNATEAGDEHLLPLVLDLTNPSPPIGWGNAERSSIAARGPADLALALALVHHLAIGNNVPLDLVATYLAGLCRTLIIEFVPKSDDKVKLLLAAREDVFPEYTPEGFEAAFATRFTIERRESIAGSGRTLYLLRRRP